MIEAPPPLPQGDSHFHTWARWVQQTLLRLRMCDVPGARVNRTTRGVQVLPGALAGQGRAGGGPILMTVIRFIDFDTLLCRPDGGASDGSSDVVAAVAPEVANAITREDIDGERWDYTGYTISSTAALAEYEAVTHSRLATRYSDSLQEYQVITPRFVGLQKIILWRCLNTGIVLAGGAQVPYQHSGCRAWAKQLPAE